MHLLRYGQAKCVTKTSQFFSRSVHTSEASRPSVVSGPFLDTTKTVTLGRSESSKEKPSTCDPLQPRIKALLVDAAGTLISPSEPVAEVCAEDPPDHNSVLYSLISTLACDASASPLYKYRHLFAHQRGLPAGLPKVCLAIRMQANAGPDTAKFQTASCSGNATKLLCLPNLMCH